MKVSWWSWDWANIPRFFALVDFNRVLRPFSYLAALQQPVTQGDRSGARCLTLSAIEIELWRADRMVLCGPVWPFKCVYEENNRDVDGN